MYNDWEINNEKNSFIVFNNARNAVVEWGESEYLRWIGIVTTYMFGDYFIKFIIELAL